MKNILFTLTLICSLKLCSQISLKVEVKKKINYNEYILTMKLTNSSNKFYMVPLDKNNFKAYYNSEYCGLFDADNAYYYLAPSVILTESNSKKVIDPVSRRIHIDDKNEYLLLNGINKEILKKEDTFKTWMKQNQLKNLSEAERNYYVFNNLMLLKPGQTISYNVKLNISAISRSYRSIEYDYYQLDFNKYLLSFDLCIDPQIYNDLTIDQKNSLEKYEFFTGILKSNNYSFDAYQK